MKYNGVVTNLEQDFTDEEKALGRKNIGCGGIPVLEQDTVPVYSGDLVLGRRTGGSMREIAVKLRDAVNGDSLAGYLVPPRTFKGMNLICDASGNITWGVQPPVLTAGDHIYIDDHYRINTSGLQEELEFSYTPESAISAINGSALNGSEPPHYSGGDYVNIAGLIINVTGLQPSGDYIERNEFESGISAKLDASAYTEPVQSDWNQNDDTKLDYIKNKPTIPSLSGYATEEYVNEHVSGKLDSSAYHEYSAGQHLSLQNYVFNVTGLQEELQFDYDDLGKISAINGSGLYGSGGAEPIEYSAGKYIKIVNDVISVTGLQPSGNYAYASGLSAYATKQYVNNTFVFNSAYTEPVQSDWTEDDDSDLSYIKHKPVETGLIAGSGIWFEDQTSAVVIHCSAAGGGGGGTTYSAGQYIRIDPYDVISVTGLEPQVQSDWSATSGMAQILNRPDTEELDITELTPGQYISIQSGVISVTGLSATGGAGGTSGYYTDLQGNTVFEDDFTYTYDGHFSMGTMEKAMVPVSNVSSDEGKVPVVYVRDGRCYYLLERIIPTYTSATNGKILGVQNNTLAWINNPVKIVADSADIPASGSSDNILYVVAAD